ncbi:hypothetical protein BIW11_12510 [Tropilaelaps mercedesae]|uniref:Uncharacterized protein n=1 Tax=Tropilaelaps mercedesae TaxID=418985 RepID=A0A1V9X627_9ACAR|nr:hypothetical protein BIW11_12510 [Tropilaelaps mercedesae]
MRRFLVMGVCLLVAQESLGYGVVRRRPKQPYIPPPAPPQDKGILGTQYYPASHNCSSLQNFRSTDVHQVHHSHKEQPHSQVTHHVTPIVHTHLHHQPPVEVLRTTKTIYQPPDIVHRTIDYEHHDHVTTHYPGFTRSHVDYYPVKGTHTHTQSVDDNILTNRKALEVHHDDAHYQQHQHHHHHHHHDSHAHFGRVPTGNAVVTSYFNFPGSGRSDSAFQAPAPNRKVDYRPPRTHQLPAYSPLQAQSIEDNDDDDDESPAPQQRPLVSQRPRPPIYERINSPPTAHRVAHVPYYTGHASQNNGPVVFPPPPSARVSDTVTPQKYLTNSLGSPARRRPEPLQLNEKESDTDNDGRDSKNDNEDDNVAPKNLTPIFLKSPSFDRSSYPEFDVEELGRQPDQRLQNFNGQILQNVDKLAQDLSKSLKAFKSPSFNKLSYPEFDRNKVQELGRQTDQRLQNFSGQIPQNVNKLARDLNKSPRDFKSPSFDKLSYPELEVQELGQQTDQRLQNSNKQIPPNVNKLVQDLSKSSEDFSTFPTDVFKTRPSSNKLSNVEHDLKSATQEYPDFARPLRYSFEQVPTASLRYNTA